MLYQLYKVMDEVQQTISVLAGFMPAICRLKKIALKL